MYSVLVIKNMRALLKENSRTYSEKTSSSGGTMKSFIALIIYIALTSFSHAETAETPYWNCESLDQKFPDKEKTQCTTSPKGITIVKHYTDEGSLGSEYRYENGVLNGVQSQYQEDSLSYRTYYLKGKIHGKVTGYTDGKISSTTNYINGLKYGRYTSYSDGKKTSSVAYKNGWKDGKEKNYSKWVKDQCWSNGDELAMSILGCRQTSRVIKTRLEIAKESCEKADFLCGDFNRLTKSNPKATMKSEPSSQQIKDTLAPYKAECEEIGYQKGTEKFGECVLKLLDKS